MGTPPAQQLRQQAELRRAGLGDELALERYLMHGKNRKEKTLYTGQKLHVTPRQSVYYSQNRKLKKMCY